MVISLAWVKAKESPVIDLKTRPRPCATISDRDEPSPTLTPAKHHGRQAAAQAASSKGDYVAFPAQYPPSVPQYPAGSRRFACSARRPTPTVYPSVDFVLEGHPENEHDDTPAVTS
jgi:hypothetical protein